MTYRTSPWTLLMILLAWMLLIAAACGLILLEVPAERPDPRPLRTRPSGFTT